MNRLTVTENMTTQGMIVTVYDEKDHNCGELNESDLNALYAQLQNPFDNNEVIYRALVHNVINSSKSNDNLRRVLEVIIGVRE